MSNEIMSILKQLKKGDITDVQAEVMIKKIADKSSSKSAKKPSTSSGASCRY